MDLSRQVLTVFAMVAGFIFRLLHLTPTVTRGQETRACPSCTRIRIELEAKLSAAERDSRRKEQELKDALEARQTLERDLVRRDTMIQQTRSESDTRRATIAGLETKLRDSGNALAATRRDLQNANAAVSHHAQTISQLQTQCQVLSKEHDQTRSLLDTRTRELTIAEKFLTKHDSSTNKEIVEKMEGLNYDVSQIAMSLVDHMLGEAQSPEVEGVADSDDEIAEAVQLARSWFGTTATEALQRTHHADDSLLLEIFVQSCLTQFAAFIIVQWHFGRDYANVESLGRIFRSLEEAEPAAVSGQWKILTRRHARLAFEHDSDPPVELAVRALDYLTTVLLAAGLGRSRMSMTKAIWECVGDRVEQFVQDCLRLNDAVGDGTVSAVMSPIWVAAEEKWDARRMEVVNGGQDDSDRPIGEYGEELVLCTTGLGLLRGERKEDGKKEERVLTKAKVAMWSVLNPFSAT